MLLKKNSEPSAIINRIYKKYQPILGKHLVDEDLSLEKIIENIEAYYESIIACMPGNVYWLDENGIGLGCNQNVLNMFGMKDTSEFRGLTFEAMGKIGKWSVEAEQSFKKDTLDVIATGKAILNIKEPPISHADGREIYFLTSRVPLTDKTNHPIGAVGISVDITELKNTQDDLEKEKKLSETANQLKTEFIRNMEHDIRTPFSGIYAMVKILEERETDLEKKHCLSLIANSAEQLLNYCNGILEFSKLEAGISPLLAKRFNLSQLINDVIAMEKPPAEIKKLSLDVEYSKDLPLVFIS